MTEADWLVCCSLSPMLEFLRGKASDRKQRNEQRLEQRPAAGQQQPEQANQGVLSVRLSSRLSVRVWRARGEKGLAMTRKQTRRQTGKSPEADRKNAGNRKGQARNREGT
jgi:hypothetical protein